MKLECVSESEAKTRQIGKALGQMLKQRPAAVLLSGDLGAGKTTLSQAIVSGCGCSDLVTSPTYTLMNVYGDGSVYHYDLYRLEDEDELYEIGFEETLDEGVPVIIEWPALVTDYPFDRRLDVTLEYGTTANVRHLVFETTDEKLMEGLEQFAQFR